MSLVLRKLVIRL
jgi:hypothetical protein